MSRFTRTTRTSYTTHQYQTHTLTASSLSTTQDTTTNSFPRQVCFTCAPLNLAKLSLSCILSYRICLCRATSTSSTKIKKDTKITRHCWSTTTIPTTCKKRTKIVWIILKLQKNLVIAYLKYQLILYKKKWKTCCISVYLLLSSYC